MPSTLGLPEISSRLGLFFSSNVTAQVLEVIGRSGGGASKSVAVTDKLHAFELGVNPVLVVVKLHKRANITP